MTASSHDVHKISRYPAGKQSLFHYLNTKTAATMARTKSTATNANPMPRKGHATTPKATSSRPAPAPNTTKKSSKQGTQQPPIASTAVTAGRVKKGQAKTISKTTGRVPKKPVSVHPDNFNFEPNQEYRIRGIMAETKAKFKIRWAGKDSAGGNFRDTWVPRSFAKELARLDWALRKAKNKRHVFNESDSEEEEEQRPQQKKTKAATKKGTKTGARKAKGRK